METPLEKLKRMTAWDVEPELTEEDLEALLAAAAVKDSAGLYPTNEDWTPAYDLNAAAAAGWLAKAGRASILTEEDPPGSGTFTSKVFENCRAMARMYSAKRNSCLTTNEYSS